MSERLPFDLATVVTDALIAAADDVGPTLTRSQGAGLADRLIDHLELLGYRIDAADHRPASEDP